MGNMLPFDDLMYSDSIQIIRVRRAKGGGFEQKHFDAPPEPPEPALVTSRQVERTDARTGRTGVMTIWSVRTPVNRQIMADDMLLFIDASGDPRRLVAEGASVPRGDGDIDYLTECTERT